MARVGREAPPGSPRDKGCPKHTMLVPRGSHMYPEAQVVPRWVHAACQTQGVCLCIRWRTSLASFRTGPAVSQHGCPCSQRASPGHQAQRLTRGFSPWPQTNPMDLSIPMSSHQDFVASRPQSWRSCGLGRSPSVTIRSRQCLQVLRWDKRQSPARKRPLTSRH